MFVSASFQLVVALIVSVSGQESSINIKKFPILNRYDNYHDCIGRNPDGVYCIVDTMIKPDSDSKLFNEIMEYSKDYKKHYRRDMLTRGLCIETCQKTIDELAESEKYYVEEFPRNVTILFDSVDYPNATQDRVKYSKIVNQCVNVELMKNYKLQGFSTIEYCVNATLPPKDLLDIFAQFFFLILFLITIISSLYDRYLRNKSTKSAHEFYNSSLHLKSHKILTLFSIRRNWSFLSAPTMHEDNVKFQAIQGVRGVMVMGVCLCHTYYFADFLPSVNPEAGEAGLEFMPSFLILNGLQFVQIFFFLSGFFAAYVMFTNELAKKASAIKIFTVAFFRRYIRFGSLQAVVILLHATWLYRWGHGPIFNKINFAEREFCRRHWWKNMLFIDNYTNVPEKCLIQTWHLDCDFWLSALGIFMLLIIRSSPKLKTFILSSAMGLSMFITGWVTWTNKLEPIYMFPPETIKNRIVPLTPDEPNYFELSYTPTHMNMSTYICGIIFAFIYLKHKDDRNFFRKTSLRRIVWWIFFALGAFSALCAYYVYNYDIEKPSVEATFYAIVYRNSIGLLGLYVIAGFLNRYGWFMSDFFSHPFWRIPGKISFSSYIVHNFVLQLVLMDVYQPIVIDNFKFLTIALAVSALSMMLGLVFSLTIEVPIARFFYIFEEKLRQPKNGVSWSDHAEMQQLRVLNQ